MKTIFFLFAIVVTFQLQATAGPATPQNPAWETEAILQQMRWSIHDPVRRTSKEGAAPPALEDLFNSDPADNAKNKAITLLKKTVADAPADLLDAITTEGMKPGLAGAVRRARDTAYDYAVLYLLTGDPAYSDQSATILLRFAEVLPQWPVYDKEKKRHAQTDLHYFKHWQARGLWGRWFYLDLAESLPLLRAFDIIRPTLSPEQKETITNGLFRAHKELCGKFDLSLRSNLMGYHLTPLILFGKVLDDPSYIHEALRYWDELLRDGYFPDGFWKETTPDYHRQITTRLVKDIPALLKGYSDPDSYIPPANEVRLKNLDLAETMRVRFERMRRGLDVLALPDGTYLSTNDAWPKKQKSNAQNADTPGLLGAAGLAKLGAQQMSAFLKFTGIRGHDHRDALNLTWFAGGREVFSETGYQPIPGSSATREWIASTASHHTVAIDESEHYSIRSGQEVSDPTPRTAFLSRPPQKDANRGEARSDKKVEAASGAAGRFTNQGKLLLWDGSRPDVQAMEAEAPNTYPGVAPLFRRTILFVPLADGEGYLVDIFRVKGGSKHDFFLRGGLDEAYTMEFDLPLSERSGKAHTYITLKSGAEIDERFNASTHYPDGLKVHSSMVGSGSSPAKVELLFGEAPAIRRKGEAPFSFVRRTSLATDEPLESCFVWIHETTKGEKRVRNGKLRQSGMDLVLEIDLEGRTDLVFSGLSPDSQFTDDSWHFQGRLAYATKRGDAISGVVFEGGPLLQGTNEIAAANLPITGNVVTTHRIDAGDASDSAVVELNGEAYTDEALKKLRLAHFDLGEVIRYSIPVQEARREGGQIHLILSHTPGFTIQPGEVVMTEYPGWRIFAPAEVQIDSSN